MIFFFNDTATTEIYTLSLHDALPILPACSSGQALREWAMLSSISWRWSGAGFLRTQLATSALWPGWPMPMRSRSEEHTSELQSQSNLVCRLLLEKKKLATIVSMRDAT